MKPSNSLILGATTSSVSFVSSTVWSWDIVQCSFQAVVSSGSINGKFTLQASNEIPVGMPPNQFVPTNWFNVSSVSQVSGSSSSTVLTFGTPKDEVCFQYLRVTWVPTNGLSDGAFTVRFNAFAL